MRIAQVAPLFESVPPSRYGGTERVVSYLTEELVAQGHEVTLFASGDSKTNAELIAICQEALRRPNGYIDPLVWQVLQLEAVAREAPRFDLIHFHCDYFHFPISRAANIVSITTLHGRLDLPDLAPLYREYRDMPVVSISDAQREPLPHANWLGTVYHGLPRDRFRFVPRPSDPPYLAVVGRISPEKGVDTAIEIATRAGINLKIAAKVDPVDLEYFRTTIEPLLGRPGIEFLGEIDDSQKQELLGSALALLFPIDWPEPFGLVMIEAMACGTPVIAARRGSVQEVVRHGITGLVFEGLEQGCQSVESIGKLSRARCRAEFERRFTAERMAREYLRLYEVLVASDLAAAASSREAARWS